MQEKLHFEYLGTTRIGNDNKLYYMVHVNDKPEIYVYPVDDNKEPKSMKQLTLFEGNNCGWLYKVDVVNKKVLQEDGTYVIKPVENCIIYRDGHKCYRKTLNENTKFKCPKAILDLMKNNCICDFSDNDYVDKILTTKIHYKYDNGAREYVGNISYFDTNTFLAEIPNIIKEVDGKEEKVTVTIDLLEELYNKNIVTSDYDEGNVRNNVR